MARGSSGLEGRDAAFWRPVQCELPGSWRWIRFFRRIPHHSALVNAYNTTSNPGRYVLLQRPYGWLAVVGTAVKDETGALQEVSPLLDTHINLVASPRTVEGTLEAIHSALQSTTGKDVLDGDFFHSLLLNTHATVGGEDVAARALLEEALASTGRHCSTISSTTRIRTNSCSVPTRWRNGDAS